MLNRTCQHLANDLPTGSYNGSTGSGSAGVEFVVTSVTSPGLPEAQAVGPGLLQGFNDHMKYIDLAEKGYYILDVNKSRVQADWYFVDRIDQLSNVENYGDSWKTDDGSRHLSSAVAAAIPDSSQIGIPAPFNPRSNTTSNTIIANEFNNVLLSIYPNPFNNQITVQYTIVKDGPVQMYIYDALGRVLTTENFGMVNKGIHRTTFAINNLLPGAYVLVLDIDGQKQKRIVVRK